MRVEGPSLPLEIYNNQQIAEKQLLSFMHQVMQERCQILEQIKKHADHDRQSIFDGIVISEVPNASPGP